MIDITKLSGNWMICNKDGEFNSLVKLLKISIGSSDKGPAVKIEYVRFYRGNYNNPELGFGDYGFYSNTLDITEDNIKLVLLDAFMCDEIKEIKEEKAKKMFYDFFDEIYNRMFVDEKEDD